MPARYRSFDPYVYMQCWVIREATNYMGEWGDFEEYVQLII